MTDLLFAQDQAGAEHIRSLLLACDATFFPALSTRISIEDYAAKLAVHAVRTEAWYGTRLVGLVATYCNAPDRETAFISNVSVDPEFRRRGIAKQLVCRVVRVAEDLGFGFLALEVDRRAQGAIGLYTGLGFALAKETDMTIAMTKELKGRER